MKKVKGRNIENDWINLCFIYNNFLSVFYVKKISTEVLTMQKEILTSKGCVEE